MAPSEREKSPIHQEPIPERHLFPGRSYVVSFLPPQAAPRPQGGRRPIDHATVLKVIWFVLTVGCRWKDVPQEMGCSGETARTRLKLWEEANVWQKIHHLILSELRRNDELQLECRRWLENVAPGGEWPSAEKRSAQMITCRSHFRLSEFPKSSGLV